MTQRRRLFWSDRMDKFTELRDEASKAAATLGSVIASGDHVRIISHNDVDGICSGALALLMVRRKGGSAHLSFSGHVYAEELSDILDADPGFLLFCDMGSDLIKLLRNSGTPFLVLDHHYTEEEDENLVNPWEFQLDGTNEVSGSGVTYLVAREMDPENCDLAPIALCGAFGDMQPLDGVNGKIADEAEARSLVKRRDEIRLIGRVDRPVEYSICYSTLPFIRGLSGNQLAASDFLKEIGIEAGSDTSIMQLEDDKRDLLLRELSERMVKQGASTSEAERLFGATLRIKNLLSPTVEDVVDYLESSCSLGRYSTALSFLVGDEKARDDVERSRLKYKQMIFEGSGLFESAEKMDNLEYLVMDEWAEYSGKLCGIYANAGFGDGEKPVFGLSSQDGSIKVSGRMDKKLLKKGIDLGKALGSAAQRVGGQGGGHSVAAGAKIASEARSEFLEALDEELDKQISGE